MKTNTLSPTLTKWYLPAEIKSWYASAFPSVARYIKKGGGNLADAKDVFHDGLVLLLQKAEKSGDTWSTEDHAYLIGICKNLWRRKVREEIRHRSSLPTYSIKQESTGKINTDRLLQVLGNTGQKCFKLLRACFFSRGTMDEVAVDLGYANAHSASVQKYKCIAKLKLAIKQEKIQADDFLE